MTYIKNGLSGKCGVYLLTCLTNGKRYVGSSVNMGSRIRQHFGKTCIQKYAKINSLYADIRKYGREGFSAECLEFCSPEEKLEAERKWYRRLSPEYNMVEPDECPLRHKSVYEKSRISCNTPEGIANRLKSHRSDHCRNRCRDVQRKRMISCRAIKGSEHFDFESLSEAARWLGKEAVMCSVISHIKSAISRNGTAYGYRWEVMPK